MYTLLKLKEKTPATVVYYYSAAEPDAPSDGEIEYTLGTNDFKTLKRATGDEDGYHAVYVRQSVYAAVMGEDCPEERFFAYG